MKNIFITIFFLSLVSLVNAQNEKADAEYLHVLKEYTLNEDGSIDFHYSKELKLLSHYAFHRLYGETFIIYNTEYQQLEINEAFTIMADGKKVVTPDNAFNEVLPRFANNAPAYNHIREMVVTHTGLEVGAVIHLDYTIHSKKGYYPELMFNETLYETSPLNDLTIKFNVPASKDLHFKLLNIEGEPAMNRDNIQKSYTWNFKNLPASSKESYQLNNHLDVPRLIGSSADNLQTAYFAFVSQDAFNLHTNEQMDELVKKVMSENPDALTAALALQKIVSNNLNNLNIPLEYTGFLCRTTIETWNSNQGTELEKTLLLAALMQKAGIHATPVAIIPNELFDQQIGDLLSFTKFALMVEPQNADKLLISSNETDTQNQVFNVTDQKLVKLDNRLKSPGWYEVDKSSNQIQLRAAFHFKENELSGNIDLILTAAANPYFTMVNDVMAIKSFIKGGVSAKDVNNMKQLELSQEKCQTLMEFKKDTPFEKLHNYLFFEIPYVKGGVQDWHYNLLTAERKTDLEIPETIQEKYVYTIAFCDNLNLVSQPQNIEISNNAGYLLIRFEELDEKLVVTREINFSDKVIGADAYEGFKQIMDAWNNPNFQKILFKIN